jgi:hypothetical protein
MTSRVKTHLGEKARKDSTLGGVAGAQDHSLEPIRAFKGNSCHILNKFYVIPNTDLSGYPGR